MEIMTYGYYSTSIEFFCRFLFVSTFFLLLCVDCPPSPLMTGWGGGGHGGFSILVVVLTTTVCRLLLTFVSLFERDKEELVLRLISYPT